LPAVRGRLAKMADIQTVKEHRAVWQVLAM